ncbi:hypothetical protein BA893_16180 [Vibrio natriegens]|uniref:hypothetical protein n=1 Tax=Vibrio natriegens TaxID=691 RepID=UPI000803FAC3|nr:hypothetical protein [Vibrio natriegens]ANQ23209.1 hypothetical protein BA893_16180 [Vibrio natriegens]
MLWFIPLNILLFFLMAYPRRTLNQNSFYITYNPHLKENVVTKFFKKVIIKVLKPFLVRDKANNLSFWCFCNSLLAITTLDLSTIWESLLISVNAACIFHYFVVSVPNERYKIATLRKLYPIMDRFMSNDDMLYLLLGYKPEEVELNDWHKNDLERLKFKIIQRLEEPVGGDRTCCLENWTNPPFTLFKPHAPFLQFWELLVQLDRDFFSLLKSIDLSQFPDLTIAIEQFHQQHALYRGEMFEDPKPERNYTGYLLHRQKIIAEYVNTAANYVHGQEKRFKNFKGVEKIPI